MSLPAPARRFAFDWRLYVPKLVTVLKEGYGPADLRADAVAGLTVAIVALPLAMALAIASGTTPDKGLVTAVIAGFLISALGGSRVQIGGPTGAFVVVVFGVIAAHGYDGLVLATLMAGLMLVAAGLFKLGTWIKYIPEPVVTGFTSGIAVIIATSQLKDLFGLQLAKVPAEFGPKLLALWDARASLSLPTFALAAACLGAIALLRRYAPRVPGFLVVTVGAALAVFLLKLPVETIGSRFGDLPAGLPMPQLPAFSFAKAQAVLPSAFTIAFLAGVESLLSAVVADGMTGRRHRSNCELVAQGVANAASALFGGMPATGAIARTAANIRSGARSPVAGMLHAAFLLAAMLVGSRLMVHVPLAALAAVLLMVAWNMSERRKFASLLRAPAGDRLVLLLTFGLTVLVDLTVAISVGVVLASMLFMHRMAEATAVRTGEASFLPEMDVDDFRSPEGRETQRTGLPPGVEVFQFRGPLFFGAASRLTEVFDRLGQSPQVLILRLREAPVIDATGATLLIEFIERCQAKGTQVILSSLQPEPARVLEGMGLFSGPHPPRRVDGYASARALAEELAAGRDAAHVAGAPAHR
jgi:SulP family sulfate permease